MPSRSLWHHSDRPWFQTPWRTCSGTVLRSPFSSHDQRHMFSELWGKALIQTLYIIAMVLHERHRVSNQCQHGFCFRTIFLDLFCLMCNLAIVIHKICTKIFSRRKIYTNMIDAIVVDLLLVCMTPWHENASWIEQKSENFQSCNVIISMPSPSQL